MKCGNELNIKIQEGVLGTVGGPHYESPTEALWCLKTGMDVVGMSTSHEALVASYCGMKVLAFSIVTDKVCTEYDCDETTDHAEVVKIANMRAKDAETLVIQFLNKIKDTI